MNTGAKTMTITITGAAALVIAISPDLKSHPIRNIGTAKISTDLVYPKFIAFSEGCNDAL